LREQVNRNIEEIDKMMESYYSYIGSSHIDNISNDLIEKKGEIEKVKITENLDSWFDAYIKSENKKEVRIRRKKIYGKFHLEQQFFY